MEIQVGGLFGLILLIVAIWAIIKTVESPATTGIKVMWVVVILLLPLLGLILWFFLGPRRG
jgi:hypothetical protein